jgi:hypothetical protein
VDAVQVQTPDFLEIHVQRRRADIGLRRDQLEPASQLPSEQSRGRSTILLPPLGRLADLPLSFGDNQQTKPQISVLKL